MSSKFEHDAYGTFIDFDETINSSGDPTKSPVPNISSDLSVAYDSGTGGAKLRWTNISRGYEQGTVIERSINSIDFFLLDTISYPRITYYIDTSVLDPLNVYYYRIRTYNSAGFSNYSNIVVYAPTCILLTWDDNSDNELGFYIETSVDSDTWRRIATTPPDITSFIVTQLLHDVDPRIINYFRVQSFDSSSQSSYSNISMSGIYVPGSYFGSGNFGTGSFGGI